MTMMTWTAQSTLASGAGLSGTYATLATIPKEAIAMRVVSTLDGVCTLSMDAGVTDHFTVLKEASNGPEHIPLADTGSGLHTYTKYANGTLQAKSAGSGSIFVSFLVRS